MRTPFLPSSSRSLQVLGPRANNAHQPKRIPEARGSAHPPRAARHSISRTSSQRPQTRAYICWPVEWTGPSPSGPGCRTFGPSYSSPSPPGSCHRTISHSRPSPSVLAPCFRRASTWVLVLVRIRGEPTLRHRSTHLTYLRVLRHWGHVEFGDIGILLITLHLVLCHAV